MFDKTWIVAVACVAWVSGCGADVGDDALGASTTSADRAGEVAPETPSDAGAPNADALPAPDRSPASTTSPSPDVPAPVDAAPADTEGDAGTDGSAASDDDCPSAIPTAGTSCAATEGICGYVGSCGMSLATCVDGVWALSAGAGCGGGLPEGA